jgi:hypothetical protein
MRNIGTIKSSFLTARNVVTKATETLAKISNFSLLAIYPQAGVNLSLNTMTMAGRRLISLAILMFSLSGCQKLRDYLQPGRETPDCRVVAIEDQNIFPDETYNKSVYSVKYDSAGYPVLVTEVEMRYDGHMQYVSDNPHPLLYDAWHRLIEESSSRGTSRYVRRYVYEGDSQLPVRDTLRLDGANDSVFVEVFEYDQAERITRIMRRQIDRDEAAEPDIDLRYYYDIRGNRQENASNPGYNGIIRYINKPSLYSLHPVWQLRYRDFSKNATGAAKVFNEHGLPTVFADSSNAYFQPFLNAEAGSTVTYECE